MGKCYALFERETPLYCRDCGKLCGKVCCKGDKNDAVFLFPYEKELLELSVFSFMSSEGNGGCDALLCGGACDRKQRPLGCRVFPLFPLALDLGDTVKISVILDPRAVAVCPLAENPQVISRRFVRAVKRCGELLLLDERTKKYLLALSDELREYASLRQKLTGDCKKQGNLFTKSS